MEAGSRVCALLLLTVLSCCCSVPAPSSDGVVGEASAHQGAFYNEDGRCPCAGPPIQPCQEACFPNSILIQLFKMGWEPAQLGCWGHCSWEGRLVPEVTHWGALLTGILFHRINFLAWPWTHLISTDMAGDHNHGLSLGTIHCRACHTWVPW